MKKLLSITVMLCMLLSACSTLPAQTTGSMDTTADPTTQAPTTETEPEGLPIWEGIPAVPMYINPALPPEGTYSVTIQRIPETVDNPQALPVIKCLYLQQTRRPVTAAPIEEANQMLAQRNAPYRLQFIFFNVKIEHSLMNEAIPGLTSLNPDYLAFPEVQSLIGEADLICSPTFTPQSMAQYLAPITDYVTGDAQPSLQSAVAHPLSWNKAASSGDIYGIPVSNLYPGGTGWNVNTAFMQEYGLTVADFQKPFWEMDEVFAALYKACGEPFLNADSINGSGIISCANMVDIGKSFTHCTGAIQSVGSDYGLDLTGERPQVIFYYENEEYRQVHDAVIRYKNAGYVLEPDYSFTTEEARNAYYKVSYGRAPSCEPYQKENGVTVIPVSPRLCMIGGLPAGLLGVSKTAAYPEQAVSFLHLLSRDEEFRIHLCYGKEGRDYKRTETGISQLDQPDGSRYGLDLTPLCSFDGISDWYDARDGMTALETYLKDMEAVRYVTCPMIFDWSELLQTADAVTEAGRKYVVSLHLNEDTEYYYWDEKQWYTVPQMTPERYEQMLQAFKAAGSDKIKSALQAQMDAWLEENPDWTAKVEH